ncbi:hypothetical protein C922_03989 [Plasmodium inui San Antonio 1]|uniref:Uncharacterized protein n=1 Tax=Plasmodium inui San Antonio 1 TaxID=1237626 RepID=W7AK78_9APIC|nr:hypothetical protein C922_03989 [Plasmodium inui San Antonio 1]EUD65741.1 hypothetical protein C922_03989 [Plasmodium inui San Antonio 1]
MVKRDSRDREISLRGTPGDGPRNSDSFFNNDNLLLGSYGFTVTGRIFIIILVHGIKFHATLKFLIQNVSVIKDDKALVQDGRNYGVHENGFEKLRDNIRKFDHFVYSVMQYIKDTQNS